MKKVLVTGGAGMIGSNFVKRLVKTGHHVKVVDNLWRGKKEYLLDDSGAPVIDMEKDFHEIDMSVIDSCDGIVQEVDYIVHLADIVAGIGYVFNNQGSIFRQNMLINSNIISSVRKHPVKGFLYVGTACSFPYQLQTGVDARPLKEEDQYPANPESGYGWSKLMGEYESLLMEKERGIPVSVLVFHNVYGSPCDYDEARSQVIPSLIRKVITSSGEPLIVWGTGSQGRAFVHVDDIVNALFLAFEKGYGQGIIQIGPGVCVSIKQLAETIVRLSGKDIPIQFDTTKPEGDKGRRADFSKAKRVLGWEPRVKLEDGIKKLYDWINKRIEVNKK
ncbi:MAG: NAD-dependent epimerase/dehydratase family protein [Candidatus Omnitrophica bacterium]|nr:NAD-dependent epimerase/dehydratase family protein [Candidatus Omnitrophota bacterium]